MTLFTWAIEGFVNHGDGAIEAGVVVPVLLLGVACCLTDVHSIVQCPPTYQSVQLYFLRPV